MDEIASFIKARDPSIVAFNRPKINPSIRMELCFEFPEESSSNITETIEEPKTEHLEVYLRIKPTKDLKELYDVHKNELLCLVPTGSQSLRNAHDGCKMKKHYSFSKIYGPDVNQTDLFNDCIKRKVLEFINGRNCTIFTYGTSGSGKTFTILGTSDNPGIIPRSLEYLFRTIPPVHGIPKVKPTPSGEVIVLDSTACKNEKILRNNILNVSSSINKSVHIETYKQMQQRLSTEHTAILTHSTDVSIGIWVSFAEVYNEYVYDLLQSEPSRGKQRTKLPLAQDAKGNTYVKNLMNISVSSGLEAYEIMQYGMHKLNYASTSVNAHSSRSHCIFTIKLVQMATDSEVQISHFNFCDLAGSERVKTTRNCGDRLKESNNINTSLHVLGRCIKSIRESQKNHDSRLIPFRDSKLTRLFQKALSGQEAIAMIVNINATREMFDESQHVLNFSAIAKDITMEKEVKPVKIPVNKRFSQYIQNRNSALPSISEAEPSEIDILREQVQELCLELEHNRQLATEKESSIRRELVAAFHKRNQESTEKWMERLTEEKQSQLEVYECRLEQMQKYYENQLSKEAKRPRISIIELDTSVSDELDDLNHKLEVKTLELDRLRQNCEEYQERNSSLQVDFAKCSFELSTLNTEIETNKKKLQEMGAELLILKKDNLHKEQLILDAEMEFKEVEREKTELQLQLDEKTFEVSNLQKEVTYLNEQLSAHAANQINQVEYVEELEEKLQDIEDKIE